MVAKARGARVAEARGAKTAKKGAARETRGSRLDGLAGYLADGSAREFDRLVYERVRLGVMSALAVNDEMSFTELRDLLGTSDGNLSVHARKLEDAGYVSCKKSFEHRVPRTSFRLTSGGRRALERYLDHMEAVIEATRG